MDMKKIFTLLAALVLSGGLDAEGASKKTDPSAKDMEQVVIEVNGTRITLGEIEARLRQLAPAVRIRIRKNKGRFLEGLFRGNSCIRKRFARKSVSLPRSGKGSRG